MVLDSFIYGYIVEEVTYENGVPVIQEGGSGDWIYVVLEGSAKVMKTTHKGSVKIDTMNEGDIFGEMILLIGSQEARTASIIADGPLRLGVLDTERIRREYASLSPRLRSLMRSLMIRLRKTTQKAVSIALESQ